MTGIPKLWVAGLLFATAAIVSLDTARAEERGWSSGYSDGWNDVYRSGRTPGYSTPYGRGFNAGQDDAWSDDRERLDRAEEAAAAARAEQAQQQENAERQRRDDVLRYWAAPQGMGAGPYSR